MTEASQGAPKAPTKLAERDAVCVRLLRHRKRVEQAARRDGLTLSAYIRRAVLRELRRDR